MTTHILIIDDEESWLESISFVLESRNYCVTSVAYGSEGIALLRANPEQYQVILLDLMMPEMDGIEVLQQISHFPELKHIPIILQTGTNNYDDIERALQLGAICCLQKPYGRAEIIPILEQVLSNKQIKVN